MSGQKKKILVVDNYDSFTWNLVHYLEELGAETSVVRNDELTVEEALASGVDGILLSPGPCTPNEAGICVELIRQAPADMPILGVCRGHQSIGAAFGGTGIKASCRTSIRKVATFSKNCRRHIGLCGITRWRCVRKICLTNWSPTPSLTTARSWRCITRRGPSMACSSTRKAS